ncbi:hypothetical protein GCM10022408_04260 [Hymenobacter fastidiosus]|uniref:PIN domain-containing protein n=1 Tax=Hymenobacter fastidiosus TaxID=486264 RepID=A0ABP7RFP3_9BACT
MSKLFFDTAPFIYLVENHPDFYRPVAGYLTQVVGGGAVLVTSVLTYTEFCVKPEQLGRPDVILDFDALLRDLDIQVLDIPLAVATLAYKLRAKYSFLKGMDSLQVASALHAGCSQFLTNDKKLKSVLEIQVVVVADL